MSFVSQRAAIVAEIERAKTAWTAYALKVDYENKGEIDLTLITTAYVAVDLVGLDGEQLDLGTNPMTQAGGQIVLAAGAKDGTGTVEQLKLLDHFTPYLQLRDDLAGVRTRVARRQPPRVARGFYYLPLIVSWWAVEAAPPVP